MTKNTFKELLTPILVAGTFLLPPNLAEAKDNSLEIVKNPNKTEFVLAQTTLKQDIGSARRTIDKKVYPTVNKVYMGGKKKVKEGANYIKRKYEEHQDKKFDRQYNKRIERLRRQNLNTK